MRAFTLDTLRRALRGPGLWVLLAVGCLLAWSGLRLAILALGSPGRAAAEIVTSTAQGLAAVGVLWVLARTLEDDRRSGFRTAADCTAPGVGGRLLGRWAGAVVAGTGISLLLHVAMAPFAAQDIFASADGPLFLLLTNTVVAAKVGAWGLLAVSLWRSAPGVLAGLLAWMAGHLPWGSAGLLEGRVGRVFGAILPGPERPDEVLAALPSGALVVVGLLGVALAVAGAASGARPRRSANRRGLRATLG